MLLQAPQLYCVAGRGGVQPSQEADRQPVSAAGEAAGGGGALDAPHGGAEVRVAGQCGAAHHKNQQQLQRPHG